MLKVKEKVGIRINFIVLAKPAMNAHVYSYLAYTYPYVFAQSYCSNYTDCQMAKMLSSYSINMYQKYIRYTSCFRCNLQAFILDNHTILLWSYWLVL